MTKSSISKILLTDINRYSRNQFVDVLGSIFEHSPWVAELAFEHQPFDSVDQLHQIMVRIVEQSPQSQRMELIRNHPELAGKEASEGTLTADSTKEQSSAGLDQCSAEELAQLRAFNQSYQDKFHFPFIIAVTGLNRAQIIAALEQRLEHSKEVEFNASITEIGKIGKIRLTALIDASA